MKTTWLHFPANDGAILTGPLNSPNLQSDHTSSVLERPRPGSFPVMLRECELRISESGGEVLTSSIQYAAVSLPIW